MPVAAEAPDRIFVLEYYEAGQPFEVLERDLKLKSQPVRERVSSKEAVRSLVYFIKQGNLHVELDSATGRLIVTPFVVSSEEPVEIRTARWDEGGRRDSPGATRQ